MPSFCDSSVFQPDAWQRLLEGVRHAQKHGRALLPRSAPPTRIYEDDLRTYMAAHILGSGCTVRTPATRSRSPDLVINEVIGVQLKLSLARPSSGRLSLGRAAEDFRWLIDASHRKWRSGPRALVIFWSGREEFRRTNVYKHCVAAERVGGPPYNKQYRQVQLEPFVGFIRQDAERNLVFRGDLRDGDRVPVTASNYRYIVEAVGNPDQPLWATCYRLANPTDEGNKAVIQVTPEEPFESLGKP